MQVSIGFSVPYAMGAEGYCCCGPWAETRSDQIGINLCRGRATIERKWRGDNLLCSQSEVGRLQRCSPRGGAPKRLTRVEAQLDGFFIEGYNRTTLHFRQRIDRTDRDEAKSRLNPSTFPGNSYCNLVVQRPHEFSSVWTVLF